MDKWGGLLAAAITGVDQLTKFLVLRQLPLGGSWPIFRWLSFTHVQNTGAAFGTLTGANRLFIAVSLVIVAVLAVGARRLKVEGGGWARWGIACVLGGACGNLIDRFWHGRVVDFVDLKVWPVFNVADSAITVGATLLVLSLWRRRAPTA
ncbi:MAG: signal peptidase II [Elusimicrobia bacterium]|nr:signal peptidase II [Elusimicrobiota bacterium]